MREAAFSENDFQVPGWLTSWRFADPVTANYSTSRVIIVSLTSLLPGASPGRAGEAEVGWNEFSVLLSSSNFPPIWGNKQQRVSIL